MTKVKFEDVCWSVGRGYSSFSTNREHDYFSGEVFTSYGIVLVYCQGGDSPFSWIRLFHDGKIYHRHFKEKKYSKRGIVTKVKQFAKEISESQE